MKIKALIAVRGGSERVKNKNLKSFAGTTLLELKIQQLLILQDAGEIDEIVVSSDNNQMLAIAEHFGCVIHERPDYFASSKVSMSEVYRYMAAQFSTDDVIMYANATSPLIKNETLIKCIKTFSINASEKLCSVNTVANVKEFLWFENKPLNYDPKNQPRSQDLPAWVRITFACSVLKANTMLALGNVVGNNPIFILTDDTEATDIDTELDFQTAEFLYETLSRTC